MIIQVLNQEFHLKVYAFKDKYDTELVKAGVDEYDEIYKKYCAGRETNAKEIKWSDHISDIYTKFTAEKDYELLKEQGFTCFDKK